jgi:hypothetical protein
MIAGVAAAYAYEQDSRAAARAAERVTQRLTGRLATCLLGDAVSVMSASESPEAVATVAVRAFQLSAMGLSPAQRLASRGPLWPGRCSAAAHALAADEIGRGRPARAATVVHLAAALEAHDSASADWTPSLLAWLADVRAASRPLRTDDVDVAEEPPRAPPGLLANVDTLDRQARLLPGTSPLSSVHFDRSDGDTAAFVLDEAPDDAGPQPSAYCVYARGEARCHAIRGAAADAGVLLPRSPSLLAKAVDGGVTMLFEARSGMAVPVGDGGVFGASAFDGGLDLLTETALPPEIRLLHLEGHGGDGIAARHSEVPVFTRGQAGDPTFNVGLFWGFVVVKRTTNEAPGVRLRVRQVVGGGVGPEVDVGQLGDAPALEVIGTEPQLQACRSRGTIALRARGWDAEYFSFHGEGRWSPPVQSEGYGGAMSCRGAEVTLVDTRGHVEDHRYEPVVRVARCTAGGCNARDIQTRDVFAGNADITPEDGRAVHAAPLGEDMVLAWSAGDVGGLRMRFGRLERLAKEEDIVLYDDHLEGQRLRVDSTLLDFDVYPVADGVLILLATTAGTFLYRVASDGDVRPVPVSFGTAM